jgi:hypothetical protein
MHFAVMLIRKKNPHWNWNLNGGHDTVRHKQTVRMGTELQRMKRKIYEPVREFERATSYCPLYLAWRILDEARDYFRTPIPEAFADQLARRAEAVFARHPFWQRQFQSQRGRDAILTSMRHWLAGSLSSVAAHCEGRMLAKERPALFRDLPESFKVGQPLPQVPRTVAAVCDRRIASENLRTRRSQNAATTVLRKSRPVSRFVHGCELLPA